MRSIQVPYRRKRFWLARSGIISALFGFFTLLQALSSVALSAPDGCQNLRIEPVPPQVATANSKKQLLEIQILKTSGRCSFFLGATKGSSPSFDRRLMLNQMAWAYNLYTSSTSVRVLKDSPDANADEVMTGSFTLAGAEKRVVLIYLSTSITGLKPAGVFNDQVMLHLYQGPYRSAALPIDTKLVPIALISPLIRQLSLVDSGAAFDSSSTLHSLDFGELTSGKSLGLDMVVRSNAGFSLQVSSRNRGRLLNVEQAGAAISYQMIVDGIPRDLSKSEPTKIASGNGTTPESGSRHGVSVVIGNTTKAPAGNYSDAVTVTVEGY
jgi:spore coat protein U-like protein